MLRSHGDSGIYDGIQADVHQGLTVRAKREFVLPDLAVRREQQVVAASVQYIAKHVIMNLMWIAMLFTPIRKKFKSTGNINIFSRHGRKFHVSPSCHTEKSNQKAGSSGQHHRRNDRHDDRRQRHDSHEDVRVRF
jgi:hypothetical protein